MGDEVISCSRSGRVARIGINRPEKRNALANRHWVALEAALDRVAGSEADILVLSGVPGAFSAGADIDELGELLATPEAYAAANDVVQRTQMKLQRLPQTTLAVIDGACVGGGLGLALACDLRLASGRSRFAITPARLGLVYSAADSQRLVHAVGMARAREMLLTGRLLDADVAGRWGLVNQVVEADGLAAAEDALVGGLQATSGQARRGIKAVLAHLGADPEVDSAGAAAAFNAAFYSSDFAEGAAAFLARRPPVFSRGGDCHE